MSETQKQPSPDKLVTAFSSSPILLSLVIALTLHVVVVGGTSWTSIRDWMDPEGAEARRAAAQEIQQAKAEAAESKQSVEEEPAAKGETKSTEQESTGTEKKESTEAKTEQEQKLDENKDKPVVKRVTEKAKPKEIPDTPELGLSLDDTNIP